ncbi:ATP-binding protein [Catenuloplanes indicus]|uniref:Anti-sigma regulatory factor (Ser/Thr protein kinase) n=1 Tax=Catenuloplanes indicus TaxID=137267 RepID=A0AAE3W363_9ACTN|nr:ATP-binding protein [Catenuloplanes indicus]MDQ0368649.1 anti-sigma regulatory factor (Ser/Thr protein kinase) [Catenuloplanes indicus]
MADHHPVAPLAVPPAGAVALLETRFDASGVTALRHHVAARAAVAGLRGERLDDFVLAVYELLTNAVRHGGGHGRLHLWHDPKSVTCEVADTGGGFDPVTAVRLAAPPVPATPGGWGLFLADKLTDMIEVTSGPRGTTVRISSALT